MKHTIPAHLLQRRAIRVVVIGCGGNGSVMVMGLPYIHQALLLAGHPGGLDVTLIDGDVVSPTNCVRQPFSQSEIGLSKSVVLASRINLFWGLQWKAIQEHVSKSQKVEEADIVISCVDTRSARADIDKLGWRKCERDVLARPGKRRRRRPVRPGPAMEPTQSTACGTTSHSQRTLSRDHGHYTRRRRCPELQRAGGAGTARTVCQSNVGQSRAGLALAAIPAR